MVETIRAHRVLNVMLPISQFELHLPAPPPGDELLVPVDDGGRRMLGVFRLRSPEEGRGPIALGCSSHFEMSLFLPATDA